MFRIDPDKCIGCEMCKDECPVEAIELEDGVCVISEDVCIGCGNCKDVCPMDAPEEVEEEIE